jgi:hypothetical protein
MSKHLICSLILGVLGAPGMRALAQDPKTSADDRAKQLFQKMEERLAKVKTLDGTVELKWEITGKHPTALLLAGSLSLAEGNRTRLDLREQTEGRPLYQLLISDGCRAWYQDAELPKPQVASKVPANLNAEILTHLARSGLLPLNSPLPPVEVAESKERFSVSKFRLGPKEKIGEREALQLEYRLDIKDQKGPKGEDVPFAVTVWLDPATSFPIKRVSVLAGEPEGERLTITERYGKLVIDRPVDPRKFELPKEK